MFEEGRAKNILNKQSQGSVSDICGFCSVLQSNLDLGLINGCYILELTHLTS